MKIEINGLVCDTIPRDLPGSIEGNPTLFLRYRSKEFFITIHDLIYLARIVEAAYPRIVSEVGYPPR